LAANEFNTMLTLLNCSLWDIHSLFVSPIIVIRQVKYFVNVTWN